MVRANGKGTIFRRNGKKARVVVVEDAALASGSAIAAGSRVICTGTLKGKAEIFARFIGEAARNDDQANKQLIDTDAAVDDLFRRLRRGDRALRDAPASADAARVQGLRPPCDGGEGQAREECLG